MVGVIDEEFYYEYALKMGVLRIIEDRLCETQEQRDVIEEAIQLFREKDWERKILCAQLILAKAQLGKTEEMVETLR